MKKFAVVALMLVVVAGGIYVASPWWGKGGSDASWERVLSFDVTRRKNEFKSDLGNHQMVIARYEDPVGWEVGVYAYPVTDDSDNLLAGDKNWRGAQPWQSFAMTRHRKLYPDTRVIEYGPSGQKLKIVLSDCRTEQDGEFSRFRQGRIEIFYCPPHRVAR